MLRRFFSRRWRLTGWKLLILLTGSQIVNYFDRGVLGGQLSVMTADPSLGLKGNESRQGMIGSAFVLGFLLAAPAFGHASQRVPPTRLIALGLMIWAISSVCAAFSPNFPWLLVARACTGIGEASFVGLAPTLIDEAAPLERRNTWLSCFYAALPVGVALGYICSGNIALYISWRATFVVQGMLMAPLALSFFLVADPTVAASVVDLTDADPDQASSDSDTVTGLRGQQIVAENDHHLSAPNGANIPLEAAAADPTSVRDRRTTTSHDPDAPDEPVTGSPGGGAGPKPASGTRSVGPTTHRRNVVFDPELVALATAPAEGEQIPSFFQTVVLLASNHVYVVFVAGYTALIFVSGVLGLFAPSYLTAHLRAHGHPISPATISSSYGVVFGLTGLLGTFTGGYWVDRGPRLAAPDATLRALWFSLVCCLVAAPFVVFAFAVGNTLWLHLALVFVGAFFMAMPQGPINGVLLAVVPRTMRSPAMAMSITVTHLFGDLPSPFVAGALLRGARRAVDADNAQQQVMSGLASLIFVSVLLMFAAVGLYSAQYRRKQGRAIQPALDFERRLRRAYDGARLDTPRGSRPPDGKGDDDAALLGYMAGSSDADHLRPDSPDQSPSARRAAAASRSSSSAMTQAHTRRRAEFDDDETIAFRPFTSDVDAAVAAATAPSNAAAGRTGGGSRNSRRRAWPEISSDNPLQFFENPNYDEDGGW